MKVGLTGGIACGKSTVSQMLARYGAAIIDADVIARDVVEPGHPVLPQVVEAFGSSILTEKATLDRKKLGEIIFQDEAKRKMLESILHPPIRALMKLQMEEIATTHPEKLIVVAIPLLYESGYTYLMDEIMVVYIPEEMQRERLMQRDHLTSAQAQSRINAQLSIEWKKQQADVVIDNQGSIANTEKQVLAWLKEKGYA